MPAAWPWRAPARRWKEPAWAVESALALPSGALDVSRQVFAETGNTSSAAIFFTLETLLFRPAARREEGLGIGIGPGVTLALIHLARVPSAGRLQNVAGAVFPQAGER